jgi:hypothetical protein
MPQCSTDHEQEIPKPLISSPYTTMIRYCYTMNTTPLDRGTMDESSTEKARTP